MPQKKYKIVCNKSHPHHAAHGGSDSPISFPALLLHPQLKVLEEIFNSTAVEVWSSLETESSPFFFDFAPSKLWSQIEVISIGINKGPSNRNVRVSLPETYNELLCTFFCWTLQEEKS